MLSKQIDQSIGQISCPLSVHDAFWDQVRTPSSLLRFTISRQIRGIPECTQACLLFIESTHLLNSVHPSMARPIANHDIFVGMRVCVPNPVHLGSVCRI